MIYFIEDDPNIRELVIYTLNTTGENAVGFERPSDFWKALDEKLPKLVLLDVMLPEEDGLSILKKIRSSPLTKHIPVIMITAKGTEVDKLKGFDLLKMLNFKNIRMDSDVIVIIALIFLLSTEDTDELLLLALVYIML